MGTLSLSWKARRPQSYAPTAWRGPMAKVLHSHCLGRPNGHRATFLLYGEARRPQIVTLKLRAENLDLQKQWLVPKLFLTRLGVSRAELNAFPLGKHLLFRMDLS